MNYKKGDRVKSAHHSPAMPKGKHGTVHSVHNGKFYGIHASGGTVYLPATHVNDPDSDGDNDTPGAGGDTDNDAADLSGAILGILRNRMR